MAELSVIFDGLQLNSPGRKYRVGQPGQGPDWGSQAVADELLTGEYRLGELDQVAAEKRLRRIVRLPIRVNSVSPSALATDQQALTSRLAGASIAVPKTMTVTLKDSTAVSTFNVFGGSWAPVFDQVSESQDVLFGTLTLVCDWPVWGATQLLGSSGAPLVTNAVSPAAVTLAPSPVGDISGDVTLFVKNRDAAAIRSLIVAGISGDTTWTAGSPASGWTADGDGVIGTALGITVPAPPTIALGGHFIVPTLPSDRAFRVLLRAHTADGSSPAPSIRIRLVSGGTEVISPWRTLPVETAPLNIGNAMDMGAYTFPVGSVGSLGAQTTTVFIEALGSGSGFPRSFNVYEALFVPDTQTMIVETIDTGKTIAGAAGSVRIENDQAYTSTGSPAGGVVTGAHIRTQGGRYHVYASKGYLGSLDDALPWAPTNVDVWASFTPRYIGLAA